MLRAGVDLGGTKIQTVIVDPLNRRLGEDRRPTPTKGGPDGVVDAIAESVRAAASNAGVELSEIVGVGIGSPGQIDVEAGTVANAGNLPRWTDPFPLAGALTKRLGISTALGNDVQVAVNAEVRLGAGRHYNSLLGVFCGTGVGGGVVIGNEIWLGKGAAGEIGHVVVEAEGGPPCSCGKTGCMEAYAGRAAMETEARRLKKSGKKTALFKIMKKKKRTRVTSGVWAKALKKDDKVTKKLINRAVWALGQGIGSSVNLLDVDAVIIGGGLGIRLGQPFVNDIESAMTSRLLKPANPPRVVLAELGDYGGALGAALLVEEIAAAEQVPELAASMPEPATVIAPPEEARASAPGSDAADAAVEAPAAKVAARRIAPAKKAPAPTKKAPATISPAKRTVVTQANPAASTPAAKAPAAKSPARKAPAKKAAAGSGVAGTRKAATSPAPKAGAPSRTRKAAAKPPARKVTPVRPQPDPSPPTTPS